MPISLTMHKNCKHLINLLRQSSMKGDWALQQSFIAGSMFTGRLEALESIQPSTVDTLWSEEEEGQTDGTISHALERLLPLIAAQHGWTISQLPGYGEGVIPGFGYQMIQ